jgi:N-methylhydantoinase A/oxoprolinase/acetone carboxylase beta subunit
VTLRAIVRAYPTTLEPPHLERGTAEPETDPAEVHFGGRTLHARRVRRERLRAGHKLEGPVIIQEYSGTSWLPPRCVVEVDQWGCLHMTPDG